MKKFSLILTAALMLFLVVPSAYAAEFQGTNSYSLGKTEIVSDDLYAAGQDITIDGTVERSANLGGRTIVISGEVRGDVQAMGETVRVTGKIDGTLRVAASTLVISGTVGRDVFSAAAQTTLDTTAVVSGSLYTYSGQVDVNGKIDGDLRAGAGTVNIVGGASGNAYLYASQITFGDHGAIGGNLRYTAPQKLSPTDQQKVRGTLDYHETSQKTSRWSHQEKTFAALVVGEVFARVYATLALGLIALLALWLAPILSSNVVRQGSEKITKNLLNGALFFLIVPFVLIAILFTIIGIPLALLLGVLYAAAFGLSMLPVAHWVGTRVLAKTQSNRYLVVLVGLVITEIGVGILKLIPVFGSLTVFVVSVWGFGVILATLWYMVHPKTPKVVETVK